MLKLRTFVMVGLVAALSGCGTFGEEVEGGMIPPSANYAPIQAPVYPPLTQPYSPNLLNDDNGRVMNIDRLNVGEANIGGYPQQPMPQAPNAAPNYGNPNGVVSNTPSNPSVDIYIKDQRGDYMPNYTAPNEVVPYEQAMPMTPANPTPVVPAPVVPAPVEPTPSAPITTPVAPTPNEPVASVPAEQAPSIKPEAPIEPNIIPNSPLLTPDNTIELSAVGMGVAPESTISPSQALALAKRAAIIDAYRQIGEKMYGIRLNAQDTVRDMVLINSVVKTKVEALIKNAEIIETVYKDGLCQITMELKLDGKVWHKILSDNK